MSDRAGTPTVATPGAFKRVIPLGCKPLRSQPTYRQFETAVQSLSRATILKTKAHVSLHHYVDLNSRRDARRHGADSRDLRHDWV